MSTTIKTLALLAEQFAVYPHGVTDLRYPWPKLVTSYLAGAVLAFLLPTLPLFLAAAVAHFRGDCPLCPLVVPAAGVCALSSVLAARVLVLAYMGAVHLPRHYRHTPRFKHLAVALGIVCIIAEVDALMRPTLATGLVVGHTLCTSRWR